MSGQELGRPSYNTGAPIARGNMAPPELQASAGAGRGARPGRAASGLQAEAPAERGRQARKQPRDEQPVIGGGTVYVPVRAGRGFGYGLWRFVRFVVLIALWLALTMFKVALSPFVHIMGGSMGSSRRPRWWD